MILGLKLHKTRLKLRLLEQSDGRSIIILIVFNEGMKKIIRDAVTVIMNLRLLL